MRDGARVRLDFEYSPSRVKVIKATPGARFHGDDKSWSIPIEHIDSIVTHGEFPAYRSLQGLGDREVIPFSADEAGVLLRKNPFKVPEEVLAGVLVECVIRIHPERRAIRVIPRWGSNALKVIKRFKGALFSGANTSYSVPTERLPELLKKFRDKEISFAVAELAGEALSRSASARSDVVANPTSASAEALTEALLTPFIMEVEDDDSVFYFVGVGDAEALPVPPPLLQQPLPPPLPLPSPPDPPPLNPPRPPLTPLPPTTNLYC